MYICTFAVRRWFVMSDEREERIIAEIPETLKRHVDIDDRTNKEVVEAALCKEFGGKKKSVLEVQIQNRKDRLANLREEISNLQEREEELEAEIASFVEQRENLQDEKETYEDRLNNLLDRMEAGDREHVWPDSPPVQKLVRNQPQSTGDAFADLKQRAKEQQRDITNYQFMKAVHARQSMQAEEYIYEVDNE